MIGKVYTRYCGLEYVLCGNVYIMKTINSSQRTILLGLHYKKGMWKKECIWFILSNCKLYSMEHWVWLTVHIVILESPMVELTSLKMQHILHTMHLKQFSRVATSCIPVQPSHNLVGNSSQVKWGQKLGQSIWFSIFDTHYYIILCTLYNINI